MVNPLASSPLPNKEEMNGFHYMEFVDSWKSCKYGEGLITFKTFIDDSTLIKGLSGSFRDSGPNFYAYMGPWLGF